MSSRLELIGPQGLRTDGRRFNELRNMNCKPSVLSQADGSAYIEQGNTKCLAAVYGPREARTKAQVLHNRANINVEISLAPFSMEERKKRSKSDKRILEIASAVKQTFEPIIMTELYARSQIDIYLQILQFDGGTVQICINAATLAIIDAGIPMKDYVCACSAGCIDDEPVLDLNHLEESNTPELTVALLPKNDKITLLQMESRLHIDKFQQVMEMAAKGCKEIHTVLDKAVRENIKDLLKKSSI
ncbi:ribosomal protein S5 domain 2-like protein [Rhizophagus irregularis]|uniref:Ribosomal RNA-processing protein 41 n=2 Tax=Rhizophagus irregularis TaxID=588596 RepID=A0A2N0P644_9GLOM|nr:ribosomal protein S5 domain 2-type protein [Rhizophagus irregularis DAOM 181602=DAOM 197198]PKC02311.1 ribosomal protein S5 domain 2-like protein [Rhizophagus irregularis]PKC62192.1 ribosomal protein S5 domain 2-like protein [Rhizophagus irregularis]POG75783.1 ribosomal protein S5 domain 2-type protein [Rhizophagus irregularis DAOM 181602=DAOM 197198]|eukprot:XP_025182649.1 ribosomal protein S5 domain 2-type protein [Rhizophagus irregularis DAOM 181602=DAOM 197198]